jgi:hypothetical protein
LVSNGWIQKEPAIRLQSTFIMHYNCIFHACHCEKHHNVYPHSVMFPFGIGSIGTDQKLFQKKRIGTYRIPTDCGTWYPPCRFLSIILHLHSSYEKGIIKRTIVYLINRSKGLMTIFDVRKRDINYNIQHWLNLFVNMHNKKIEKKIVVKRRAGKVY